MTKNVQKISLLAIIPIIAIAMTFVPLTEIHAQNLNPEKICGDRLCDSGDSKNAEDERKKMRELFLSSSSTEIVKTTVVAESEKQIEPGNLLKLSRASVATDIPLHLGYYDGDSVYFIITDASDEKHAKIISEKQGWNVEVAPPLENTPKEALSTAYLFVNGVNGEGIHGYQSEVVTSTPAQTETYSALTSHVHVIWTDENNARVLDSEQAVIDAETNGEVTLVKLPVVLNMPQIVWPDGQMTIKEDKTLTDSTPYGKAQVLDIDLDEMTVTFVAHRGWGPDGRTIYYIVTDATPSGPAKMMGVINAPTLASTLASSSAIDLFQFKNGIAGSGPLGFQPGIAAGAPGDENYSPLWRIFMIKWIDPENAVVLETMDDISYYQQQGLIEIGMARPMNSDHIVNCPFIDPFQ
jgi:hypothetical protein|tara:strand:- start:11 stop:1237 length:1227 start_codon:yes stop_codon:yes gene_type:complete